MGSLVTEVDPNSNETLPTATLTQRFWVSDHEVTHAEFEAVRELSVQIHRRLEPRGGADDLERGGVGNGVRERFPIFDTAVGSPSKPESWVKAP